MPGKGRITKQEVYGHFKNKIKTIGNQKGFIKKELHKNWLRF